jgi:hypothetical protein
MKRRRGTHPCVGEQAEGVVLGCHLHLLNECLLCAVTLCRLRQLIVLQRHRARVLGLLQLQRLLLPCLRDRRLRRRPTPQTRKQLRDAYSPTVASLVHLRPAFQPSSITKERSVSGKVDRPLPHLHHRRLCHRQGSRHTSSLPLLDGPAPSVRGHLMGSPRRRPTPER